MVNNAFVWPLQDNRYAHTKLVSSFSAKLKLQFLNFKISFEHQRQQRNVSNSSYIFTTLLVHVSCRLVQSSEINKFPVGICITENCIQNSKTCLICSGFRFWYLVDVRLVQVEQADNRYSTVGKVRPDGSGADGPDADGFVLVQAKKIQKTKIQKILMWAKPNCKAVRG